MLQSTMLQSLSVGPLLRAFTAAPPLGRLGPLDVRLAATAKDVRRAQRLRYKVFYAEMGAIADRTTLFTRRDSDPFDSACDHLLVRDRDSMRLGLRHKPRVIATTRLLRQDAAARTGGFYSAGAFDVEALIARHPGARFLELGRSCVLAPYRDKRTVELLWHGIWSYARRHRIDVMFGCASLAGADADQHAHTLAFLHHFAGAPEAWRTHARALHTAPMDRLPKHAIDPKRAMRDLPPLLKGYLRLGGMVAAGAAIDEQFGTTDVLIVLPVSAISARYLQHFGVEADRHAA